MSSSTWTSKPESEIFSIFIKLKGMNLTFKNGRATWTKSKAGKNYKTSFRTLKPSRILWIPPRKKSPFLSSISYLLKKKKKALVSYALPEKYKETNKEKTQPGCPQACRSQTGWNEDWWLRLLKYNQRE